LALKGTTHNTEMEQRSCFYYQTGFFDHRPTFLAHLVQLDPPLLVLSLV